MKIISVLIVGLGGIGFKFDDTLSSESLVLSHSRAFSIHPNFQVIGGVDLDKSSRVDFATIYNCKIYSQIERALLDLNPDLVVVATPTKTHKDTIKKIFNFANPSIIVCEKPLAYTLEDAEKIVKICKNNKAQLFVNYMRNSSKVTVEIKKRIEDEIIAPPFKIIQWYSKGIINSASHFVTLFNCLFGMPVKIESLSKNTKEKEVTDNNFDFKICYNNVEVFFISLQNKTVFHNSFELIAKNGRLLYERGGEFVRWFPISNDGIYPGYNMYSDIAFNLESDFPTMQLQFVNNLWEKINGREALICSGGEAIQTMILLNKILS